MALQIRLLVVITVALVAVGFPYILPLVSMNMTEGYVKAFINSSYSDRYDTNGLNSKKLSILFGALSGLVPFTAMVCHPLVGLCNDKLGRRLTVFFIPGIINSLALLAFFLSKTINIFELLFVSRVFSGLASCFYHNCYSCYVAECSPDKYRGRMVASMALVEEFFVCFSFIISMPQVLGSVDTWNYMALAALPGAVIGALLTPIFPESPKFLAIQKHKISDAVSVVKQLHGKGAKPTKVIEEFRQEEECVDSSLSVFQTLRQAHLRKILYIALLVSFSPSFCGSLIFIIFASEYYKAELSLPRSIIVFIVLGGALARLVVSSIGVASIDRYPRRILYIGSLISMELFSIIFFTGALAQQHTGDRAFAYVAVTASTMVMMTYSFIPNAMSMFYTAEITPQNARSSFNVICLILTQLSRQIILFLFPVLREIINIYSIIVLVIVPSAFIILYAYWNMPETRGKTTDEIVLAFIQRMEARKGRRGKRRKKVEPAQTSKVISEVEDTV